MVVRDSPSRIRCGATSADTSRHAHLQQSNDEFLAMNPNPQRGGIAITFDDDFIDEWHGLQDVFAPFQATATYFVCHIEQLSALHLDKLREMQAAGHEIGSHGLKHRSVLNDYQSDPERVAEYLSEEIDPSIRLIEAAGLKLDSFAFPYGHHTAAYDQAVLTRFEHARATAYKKRLRPVHWLRSIYHQHGSGQRLHHGLGIDENYGLSDAQLDKVLKRAARSGETACFYAHKPGQAGDEYIVRPERLRFLCQRAQDLGLQFRTLRELD